MATEKRKIHRVIDARGTLVQVLPETSAEQVTLADAGNKFTSTNVEGALQELATSVASAGKVDDVQDVNGSSIVTNKIAKLSKAAVGLGNVDNTADANKSVKHATSADSATTATSATTANSATKATQDASGNVITSTYATKNELRDGLAGRATTKTYESYQAFVTAMGLLSKSELKVGDNVYIKKLDVPDMWVTAVNATSVSYTYTNDQAIINALDTTSGLTVGYFSFSKLETEKVDLSTYQTKTDNSLTTADKTVVGAINEVKGTADGASAKANKVDNSIRDIVQGKTQVGRAYDVTNTINGKAITDIFETNGTTVKKATSAGSATTATTASKLAHPLLFGTYSGSVEKSNGQYWGNKDTSILFSSDFSTAWNEPTQTAVPNTFKVELKDMLTDVSATAQYSAVKVDAKGRVTAVGKSIEWGTSRQTTPSGDLMIGGLFMELQ